MASLAEKMVTEMVKKKEIRADNREGVLKSLCQKRRYPPRRVQTGSQTPVSTNVEICLDLIHREWRGYIKLKSDPDFRLTVKNANDTTSFSPSSQSDDPESQALTDGVDLQKFSVRERVSWSGHHVLEGTNDAVIMCVLRCFRVCLFFFKDVLGFFKGSIFCEN